MIALPMFAEQPLNARWLEQNNLGIWIRGTNIKGGRTVPAEELVVAIKKALRDIKIKETVSKWSQMARAALSESGSSWRDLQELMKFDDFNNMSTKKQEL